MKITLTNDFHNTSVNLVVADHEGGDTVKISASQYYRARRELCGITDCCCGGTRKSDYILDHDGGRIHGGDVRFGVLTPLTAEQKMAEEAAWEARLDKEAAEFNARLKADGLSASSRRYRLRSS